MSKQRAVRIAQLNDRLRTSLSPKHGRIVATAALLEWGDSFWEQCLEAVRLFDTFTKDNDPYGEHDFGAVTIQDRKVFWKIDYYQRDTNREQGAEDPSNPTTTERVMTIMLSEEY